MNIWQNKYVQFCLKLGVSLVLVAWLILKIDWLQVWLNVQKLTLGQILLYVALLLLGMMISSVKWHMLARSQGFRGTLGDYFRLYLTGSFINNFMPSFVGGDTYKAYALGKAEGRYAQAASTVVIDRITGFLGAIMLALFFGLLNWRNTLSHPLLVVLFAGLIGGLLALFLLEKSTKFAFGKKLKFFIPGKILGFLKILHEYYLDRKLFVRSLFWALVFGMVGLAALNYVMFWALGIKVNTLDYLSVIFLISIVSAAPISINNIGVQEWAYVTFFGLFGVDASAVIAVSIVIRILQMIVSFTALPMYLKGRQKTA